MFLSWFFVHIVCQNSKFNVSLREPRCTNQTRTRPNFTFSNQAIRIWNQGKHKMEIVLNKILWSNEYLFEIHYSFSNLIFFEIIEKYAHSKYIAAISLSPVSGKSSSLDDAGES